MVGIAPLHQAAGCPQSQQWASVNWPVMSLALLSQDNFLNKFNKKTFPWGALGSLWPPQDNFLNKFNKKKAPREPLGPLGPQRKSKTIKVA